MYLFIQEFLLMIYLVPGNMVYMEIEYYDG